MIRVCSRPRLVRVSFHQGFGLELKYCLDLRRYDSVSKDLPAILNFNGCVRRMLKHLRTPLYLGEGSKQERFLSARYVVLTSELEAIMLSHKSFLINKKLFKKMRHNRPIDR
ncbi:hypothetical protein C5167_027793 [Papaver somniferum]|nr:hypothetical protein C5167_027793 [Papaver somniferum]